MKQHDAAATHSAGPLWQKGDGHSEEWIIRYTVGDDYVWDNELLPYDVQATRAHIAGLQRIGVLTSQELQSLLAGLDHILKEWSAGNIIVRPEDEDCHTVIEHVLTERVGPAGGKVHTGRSRNDQVLAAMRLYERDRARALAGATLDFANVLIERAADHDDWLMPGYTHTQKAMPSSVGLWFGGYAETLIDDARLLVAASVFANRSPLGSGAGYGIPHINLDRKGVADDLFDGHLILNSTAVQLGRGKVEAMLLAGLTQLMLTLNRMASDLTLYASQDFDFVSFPSTMSTGSSIMPHKKNPDVLEIARASYHRVCAEHSLLLTLGANLSSGYHRDLQLSKAAVMRSVEVSRQTLDAMHRFVSAVTFNRQRVDDAVSAQMLTAGNALRATLEGRPFREAYKDNADAATRPDAATILGSYRTIGSPGNTPISELREQLEAVRSSLV